MDPLQEWIETATVQELATVFYFFRSVEHSMQGGQLSQSMTLQEVMKLVLERFSKKLQEQKQLEQKQAEQQQQAAASTTLP